MLLDGPKVLAVYLNLLLSFYNVLWNNYDLANNQLCNPLLDQLQFFECFHIILWLLINWLRKFFLSIIKLLLQFEDNISSLFLLSLQLNSKTKWLFTPWKLGTITDRCLINRDSLINFSIFFQPPPPPPRSLLGQLVY